jgi:protein SCO1/2
VCVLTMGFTRCKFACPRILSDMQHIEQALGKDADQVRFVFLSIDPAFDTPAQMTATIQEHRMNPVRWTFLTAPADIVQQTAVALDFKYQLVDGFFAHSNLIAVLDEDGKVIHREEAMGADIKPVVDAVRKLLTKP